MRLMVGQVDPRFNMDWKLWRVPLFFQSSIVELKLSICEQENLTLIRYGISPSPSQQESTIIFHSALL